MTECDDCPICADGPVHFFNWGCPGCRARWLAALPSREWRIQAVDQWRKAGETAMVAQVIEKLKEMAK